MGQYYKPIILNEKNNVITWMYSHDYGNGLKLMEHSWLENEFVKMFEMLISPMGQYHKSKVVWAGDYADHEVENSNLYSLCDKELKSEPRCETIVHFRYVVNHTKKQFVDKANIPDNNDGWKIHPLPLLTCEGNGGGGGDYTCQNEEEEKLVGSWARDVISVEHEISGDISDYQEIEFNLIEQW